MQPLPAAVEPPLLQMQVIITRQHLPFLVLYGQMEQPPLHGTPILTGRLTPPQPNGLQEALPNSKMQVLQLQQGLIWEQHPFLLVR